MLAERARFPIPLVKPCVRFSRRQLTEGRGVPARGGPALLGQRRPRQQAWVGCSAGWGSAGSPTRRCSCARPACPPCARHASSAGSGWGVGRRAQPIRRRPDRRLRLVPVLERTRPAIRRRCRRRAWRCYLAGSRLVGCVECAYQLRGGRPVPDGPVGVEDVLAGHGERREGDPWRGLRPDEGHDRRRGLRHA